MKTSQFIFGSYKKPSKPFWVWIARTSLSQSYEWRHFSQSSGVTSLETNSQTINRKSNSVPMTKAVKTNDTEELHYLISELWLFTQCRSTVIGVRKLLIQEGKDIKNAQQRIKRCENDLKSRTMNRYNGAKNNLYCTFYETSDYDSPE